MRPVRYVERCRFDSGNKAGKGRGTADEVHQYGVARWRARLWHCRSLRRQQRYVDADIKTEQEALDSYKKMEAEFEAKRKALSVKNIANISLIDYLRYWFCQIEVPNISTSTRMIYEIVLNDLLTPNIGDVRLTACTAEYFDEVLEKIAPYSKSAGNKAREFLFNAMRAAVTDGYLKNNPIENTKPYPRDKANIVILSKDELKKLMPEMCTTNWLLETMFALFCGLRKGEILGLKFSDIDLGERTVSVQRQVTMEYTFDENGKRIDQRPTEKKPKTDNAYRTLRFPEIMVPEIRKRMVRIEKNKSAMGDEYIDNDYVSCQKNGLPSSVSAFNLALERACKRSGVRKATVHSLRHIFATVLMEKGVPLVKISAVLGHSSIHTTFEFYCDVLDEKEKIKDYINDTFSVEEMEEDDES